MRKEDVDYNYEDAKMLMIMLMMILEKSAVAVRNVVSM
jgi:hypothetical protein